MLRHIDNIKKYGITPIVAINKFVTDTAKEIEILKEKLKGIICLLSVTLKFYCYIYPAHPLISRQPGIRSSHFPRSNSQS